MTTPTDVESIHQSATPESRLPKPNPDDACLDHLPEEELRRAEGDSPSTDEWAIPEDHSVSPTEAAPVSPSVRGESEKPNAEPATDSNLNFPKFAMTGSLGDLARVHAQGTEVPEEFVFACALTIFGAECVPLLKLSVGIDVEPRLYTVLLGNSALTKKSTAMRRTIAFFESLQLTEPSHVSYGAGSGEGLARALQEHNRILLAYDELRAFVEKTRAQGSTLMPLTAALFEGTQWDNTTKHARNSVSIRDAHLALLGCCTTDTYSEMWTNDAIALGFTNRLFVMSAEGKPKVAWPAPPPEAELKRIRERILAQLKRLPLTFDITPDAKRLWEDWYNNLPTSEHAKRLDTIGLRLLPILALSNDKEIVDTEIVRMVTAIMDYELQVRTLTDPIDADDRIAKLEEKIRRLLQAKGPQSPRDLRRWTNADRSGLWAFEKAVNALNKAGDVKFDGGKYHWTGEQK